MKTGGIGGANTKTGLVFEGRVDILEVFKRVPGYKVHTDGTIYFKDKAVAHHLRKNLLYKFLKSKDIDYKDILSKKLLPDDAIYVPSAKTLYIKEMGCDYYFNEIALSRLDLPSIK